MFELLHETVRHHANMNPGLRAFRCGPEQITYGELESDSNRLASFLMEQGIELGDRVGVFMPRCIQTAIAVYAILKAGGIFVPIDPHLPAGGVAQLVNDCGIQVLLTHPKKRRVLSELVDLDSVLRCIIGVDALETGLTCFQWEAYADATENLNLARPLMANDPAYIMYSSGSTGRPKGITHTHRSGLAYARLSVQTYDVKSSDVIANHSPINFDMSTFGYFASCYAGAMTLLIPEAFTKIPSSLANLVEQEEVTIWYSVPLALIQLLLRGPLQKFDWSSVRWVKFGGEPFPPKHLRALMRILPGATFSNVYGPAEVNQCTFYHVPPAYADESTLDSMAPPVPIGKIWADSEGLVLGQSDQPVNGDQTGELVVCSPTMMSGYWGRPDLNATAFYRPPGTDEPIYYRTGDLVQRHADGNLMFLGRKDRQVKVRGYRVELDEIERMLTAHDDVNEAGVYCVVKNGEKEIQATVIAKSSSTVGESDLKQWLAQTVSRYAVPTRITNVDQLPRTGSGKIDRTHLQTQAEHEQHNIELMNGNHD